VSHDNEREFLGLVAHELRSPIAVILGLAGMLAKRRDELTEGQIDESLARIVAQGNQLAGLVDDLLDLAQVEAGRFRVVLESVRLVTAGRQALEAAPPPVDRSVELGLPDDVWVTADPTRLVQVLVNLLTNAYRYGGPHVRLDARRGAEGVLITVADDGTGPPKALVETLFEKFSRDTRDGHGVGLGLAIVRGLVQAFGGRVWYEAGEPTGASFVVMLLEAEARLDNPAPALNRRR